MYRDRVMWFKKKKRQIIQVICAALYNCNFEGFVRGEIYKGSVKSVCVPGLNCYSCPGAVAACPVGSLQTALVSAKYKMPYYVLGMVLLFGIIFGRTICGFLCPFGFLQELLFRIPTKKAEKNRWTRIFSWLKYVILAVLVIGVPLSLAEPGFCKYICPAGTLEGGVPLTIANEQIRSLTGLLFDWKILTAAVILLSSIFVFRSFCRFLCPLGALYSLFNKVCITGVKVDKEKCTGCQACVKHCHMDIKRVGDRECVQCGECIHKCPCGAIHR